ncbi:MAG: SDR family NAD(P)-dependent oxidoreductase, partial [Alphaproteobacteria bacterium]
MGATDGTEGRGAAPARAADRAFADSGYGGRRFEGRAGILTGGAKGIGRAVALRFLAEGGRLAVVDQEPEEGDLAAALRHDAADGANRLLYVAADVTDEGQVRAAIDRAEAGIGPADVLINNVGFGANPRPIETLDIEEWNRFLAVNLTSAFLVTRAVLPGMRSRGYGRIVNLASIAGRSVSEISNLHYSTAKAAILGLTRKLAYEEAPNGIAVNAVAPGTTFTDRVRLRYEALDAADRAARLAGIPMRRAARPEEIAAAILFLASD